MGGGRWKVFKRQKDAWLEEYRLCHAATLAITNLPSSITGFDSDACFSYLDPS